jgi:hypothetical protein
MSFRAKRFLVSAILCGLFAISAPARADDPITDFVLGGIERKANDVVDHARDAADFVARRIGEQALAVIKAWKEANSQLLDKTFSGIDEQSRAIFNQMDQTLSRLEQDKTMAIRDAQNLTAIWSGVLKNLPTVNHDPEVLTYYPRVILPIGEPLIPLHVIGPKLASADPQFSVGDKSINVNKSAEQELLFPLDRSQIIFDGSAPTFGTFKLDLHKSTSTFWNPFSWGSKETIHRDMLVQFLPRVTAHYTVKLVVAEPKVETDTASQVVGGRGKDSPYPNTVVVPPDQKVKGWLIDVDRLLADKTFQQFQQLDGDGGSSCTGVDRNSIAPPEAPDHFTFFLQLGKNQDAFHSWDAHQNCRVFIPIKRTSTVNKPGDPIEGDLSWTDDKRIVLPSNTVSYELSLKMFNGRTYIVTEKSSDPFGVVEIQRDKLASILFRPRPPSDF